ncbi:unnamed protein product [Caretta caretta]
MGGDVSYCPTSLIGETWDGLALSSQGDKGPITLLEPGLANSIKTWCELPQTVSLQDPKDGSYCCGMNVGRMLERNLCYGV